jgi:hypothetical protein
MRRNSSAPPEAPALRGLVSKTEEAPPPAGLPSFQGAWGRAMSRYPTPTVAITASTIGAAHTW